MKNLKILDSNYIFYFQIFVYGATRFYNRPSRLKLRVTKSPQSPVFKTLVGKVPRCQGLCFSWAWILQSLSLASLFSCIVPYLTC